VVAEGFLEALGRGYPDALVNGECLPQRRSACTKFAVLEVALADSFQGPCFLEGHADLTGDGQRPGVAVAGPGAGRRSDMQLAGLFSASASPIR
jgi:hypothetical protein